MVEAQEKNTDFSCINKLEIFAKGEKRENKPIP